MKLHYDFSKSLVMASVVLTGLVGNTENAWALQPIGMDEMPRMVWTMGTEGAASLLGSTYAVDETPVIELDNRTFFQARGKVGQKVEVGKVHVKATAMPAEVSIVPSGSAEGIFTTDIAQLPAGDSEMDITVYYEAKKIGKNEGKLYFMVGEEVYEQINLKGLAIDPATPPAVHVEPVELPAFSTEVGQPVTATLTANLVGLPSAVMVKVKQSEPAFSISTGYLYFGTPSHQITVTFNPKSAGTYEAQVIFENEFFEPVVVTLKGTATAKSDEKPDVEGDQLPLPSDNPVKLLNEGFDSGVHNKPLSLKGWSNLAGIGNRAWWGYQFPDYDAENAGEYVAKVTTYDSKVEPGEETDCQMVLITPPLDYKNAASKMFTFRVMGKNMTESMPDVFLFCTFKMVDGGLYGEPVEGVKMPSTPDENGEWIDYHVDLSQLELDDVFYMGFYLMGMRGTLSSASYFVDDVSFGRTDLPMMTPDKPEITMEVAPGTSVNSAPITIKTNNLVEPVKLTPGGRDKANFEVSAKSLPKEGGTFFVKFKGEQAGSYEAYVKLTSRGAATRFVQFFISTATGLQTLVTEEADRVLVVDQGGRVVRHVNGASLSDAIQSLPAGTYVVRATGASGTRSMKIMK